MKLTMEKYLSEVIDYYRLGGVTWGQAYMRVLQREEVETYGIVVADRSLNVASNEANLPGLLYFLLVKMEWSKR